MKPLLRLFAPALLLVLATPAMAQYMRMTTDNPVDNTRLRSSGTTLVTITLDTNHDRNGTLQTCNSHTSANCGAPAVAQPLNMFSYTLAFKAVGGTVSWGTFTPADANYTPLSPQIQNDTEVEINEARPVGTVTDPGLSTLGTIPITIVSGTPFIDLQVGAGALNPFGFGTGFGTFCDGFFFGNTYVHGDPSDPCGTISGIAGDWFDFDGVSSGTLADNPPVMSAPAIVTASEGTAFSITAQATDPDAGDILTISVTGQPPFLPFLPVSGPSPLTAVLTGTPGFNDSGIYQIQWTATDQAGLTDVAITSLTVANTDRAPVLGPIPNLFIVAGNMGDQVITGSDPDGDALTFSKVSGPSFMTVTTTSPTTGNIHLAPALTDAGTYNATVRASDGLLANDRTLTIQVAPFEASPTLNQPLNMTVSPGGTADQTITGSDPFNAPLTFSKVSGPTWMTVTTTSPTTGNIHLAPPVGVSGTFAAIVQASNGTQTNQKAFSITIVGNQAPVLSPIPNLFVNEGATLDQPVSATDPDGNPLTFSKVAGPTFMTVTTVNPGTGTATGNIHLAPGFVDAGSYPATVRASDGSLSSDGSFTIFVCNTCSRPPVLDPVADMTVTEGGTLDQTITASDPDGDALFFTKTSGPIFMTVSTTSPTTGNIHLAPGASDAGTYSAIVSVNDGALSSSRSFTITVNTSGNRCPAANPGGPYSGIVGIPVAFDGSASSDPDGNPLTYAWDFDASNGITVDATGALANHAYAVAGSYTVTLTVTDNGDGDPAQICVNSATTTASIAAACDATIFNGYDTIRLGSGKPFWYGYVQPATGCYVNSDVVVSTFVMKYAGRQIAASGKTTVGGDKNGDGIAEIKVSFSKDDLRVLFSGTGLSNGHNTVTVTLEANLVSGGIVRGTTQLDVVNNGNFTAAEVSPNPLNPEATLSYTTTRTGAVRVDLFDIQGRLIRRLVDEPSQAAGTHEATIDGRGAHGEKLPSGVYYVRGVSQEGTFTKLITILK